MRWARARAGGDDALALHLGDEPRGCEAQAQRAGRALQLDLHREHVRGDAGALKDEFAGRAPDTTEENIQARCRGVLLMAISNKTGACC
jgi:NH3-dependent NAD+ synthetase